MPWELPPLDASPFPRCDRAAALPPRRLQRTERALPPSCAQALIRDKRWRNLALLAISKNRQRYNITSGNMETLAALLIEKGARPRADTAYGALPPSLAPG